MVEIKTATDSDAEVLYEISQRTFVETFGKDNSQADMDQYVAETFSIDKQLSEIQNFKRHISIAWLEGSAAGFFHLLDGRPDPSVNGAKPIELLRLYVDSQWFGKGVAAGLMSECIAFARNNGFQTLWLGVWERNFRAQAFYKKYGFKIVGEHVFKLGSDKQTDLVMSLDL